MVTSGGTEPPIPVLQATGRMGSSSNCLRLCTWCKPSGSTSRLVISYPLYTTVFEEEGGVEMETVVDFVAVKASHFNNPQHPEISRC